MSEQLRPIMPPVFTPKAAFNVVDQTSMAPAGVFSSEVSPNIKFSPPELMTITTTVVTLLPHLSSPGPTLKLFRRTWEDV